MSNTVLTEDFGDYVIITLNRPKVMNALDPATHKAMAEALDRFEDHPQQRVAIVTGAGDKAFCAGGDISTMADAKTEEDYAVPASGYGGMTRRQSRKPIIAAVNGIAFGGGFEMVLAADLAIACEHAKFGLPEALLGTAAVAGGLHRLPRMIGQKRALQMQLTGQAISAQQALAWGLINEVVASDVVGASVSLAKDILRAGPLAVSAILEATKEGMRLADEYAAMDAQAKGAFPAVDKMLVSDDVREGLRAFLEKRQPVWRNQ